MEVGLRIPILCSKWEFKSGSSPRSKKVESSLSGALLGRIGSVEIREDVEGRSKEGLDVNKEEMMVLGWRDGSVRLEGGLSSGASSRSSIAFLGRLL